MKKKNSIKKKKQKFISKKEPLDLDDLLPVLGEFGSYQKLLLWFICLPACIPCGFCAFNQLFMTDTPDDYWCQVPELSEFNLTHEQIRELAIPSTEVSCNTKITLLSSCVSKKFLSFLFAKGKRCDTVQQMHSICNRLANGVQYL